MINIHGTLEWSATHPGAIIGLLEMDGIDNSLASAHLNQCKRDVEARLRMKYAGFTRQDFLALPIMKTYDQYYNHFDKTYHVLLQVESIVIKNKNLPDVSPLVDSVFTAEVETLVLTAGHDIDNLVEPVMIDVSHYGDEITQLNGQIKTIRPGDMVMRDREGLACSILYGQDNRSPITPQTRHVLYVAYAPPGVPVGHIETHLQQVEQYVRLFAPLAGLEQRRLLTT